MVELMVASSLSVVVVGIAWSSDRATVGGGSLTIKGQELAVTNITHGGTNVAAAIALNGEWVRLRFDSGSDAPLYIKNASIIDTASGTAAELTIQQSTVARPAPIYRHRTTGNKPS